MSADLWERMADDSVALRKIRAALFGKAAKVEADAVAAFVERLVAFAGGFEAIAGESPAVDYREHSCALAAVEAELYGFADDREPGPWPLDRPVETIVARARSMRERGAAQQRALTECRASLAEGPSLPAGWERSEASSREHTGVVWSRGGGDGPTVEMTVGEHGIVADSVEADARVTGEEMAAILTIESRRGVIS